MKLGKRKVSNWLNGLQQYVEDTEAPRDFWLWGGIFTICAALQRRVWLPYGLEPIYPNIYVLFVAPPGWCRKALPLTVAKKMLKKAGMNVSKDSSSKRALTKEMAELYKTSHFTLNGKMIPQTPLAIISKEMSSLLAVDPKGMTEVLTDLFDSHDEWEYGTAGQGEDNLYGVCVSCFIATTPTWLSANLPQEAIGGGFTSRFAIVTGYDIYKSVPIPPIPDKRVYEMLVSDLSMIGMLAGEIEWASEAKDRFEGWYKTLRPRVPDIKDERLHPFVSRMHVIALKVAIAMHIAYSNELVIELKDMEGAIELLESVLDTASDALGGHGRSITSQDVENVMRQIRFRGKVTFKDLLAMNYRNTNKKELETVIETILGMGAVQEHTTSKGTKIYKWLGKKTE